MPVDPAPRKPLPTSAIQAEVEAMSGLELTGRALTETLVKGTSPLASLRAQLKKAERDDELADYIDNTDRRDAVRREARATANRLRAEIARIEESF